MDARADLTVTAGAAGRAVADSLHAAAAPVEQVGTRLTRVRLDAVLDQQAAALASAASRGQRDIRRRLVAHADLAASRRAVLEAYDPGRQLARGWTLTHAADGRLVRRARELAAGDGLVTTFADGTARSTVTTVTAGKDHADD